MKKYISIALLPFLFIGCVNLSPDYSKPINTGENKDFLIDSNISYTANSWWKDYHNDNLNNLMELMLVENQDILSAKKQILYNEENLNTISSNLLPRIDFKDDLTISKINMNRYGINISSYELDYLGKIKQTLTVSNSDINISSFNFEYLKTISSYDLVNNYYTVVSLNKQIELTKKMIVNYTNLKEIVSSKIKIGLSSNISLIDIETELNSQERNLQLLLISKNNIEKQLKNIIGKDVIITYTDLNHAIFNENMIASKAIENRFDIKIAENELIKENAKIGIAKAAYFPTLSLGAFFGVNSQQNAMFNQNNWSITPSIVFNIFDYGNTKSLVEKQKISKELALLKYTKTVRNAFLEVKTNYSNYIDNKNSFLLSEKTLLGLNKKYSIVNNNFEIGLLSKYELLINENSLLTNQIQFEKVKTDYFVSELNLRKSLNGKI